MSDLELAQVVGHLVELRRFPVRQLAGETPSIAFIDEHGLVGDRAFELYDEESGEAVGESVAGSLYRYAARYVDDMVRDPTPEWVRVRGPAGGAGAPLSESAWTDEISAQLGAGARVRCRPAARKAARPLRVISRATLRLAERAYGAPLEPPLVRANLIVEIQEAAAFGEDDWVGKRIRIGETLLEIVSASGSCVAAVSLAGGSAGDVDLLRGFLQIRGGRVGVEARAASGPRVRVGDPIVLVD